MLHSDVKPVQRCFFTQLAADDVELDVTGLALRSHLSL